MAVFGVAAGWLLFWLPNTVLRYTKPYRVSPVGEGDIALMAACGAWLGPNAVLFSCAVSISAALFLRSALALYSRRYLRQPEPEEDSAGRFVPFGPFISGAAMLLLCLDPFHLFLRIDPFQFFTSIESLHLF
jgi:prepilin signal peptidase PulO-like enzyme (type II secretory pathway)